MPPLAFLLPLLLGLAPAPAQETPPAEAVVPEAVDSAAAGAEAPVEIPATAVQDVVFAIVGEWGELSPEGLEPVLGASLADLGIDV